MIGLLVLLFIIVIVLISIDRKKSNSYIENNFNSDIEDCNCDNTDQSSLESLNDNSNDDNNGSNN